MKRPVYRSEHAISIFFVVYLMTLSLSMLCSVGWQTNKQENVRLSIPWWWISWDPKHVGVTFNFMCFKLLYNVEFNF